MRSVIEEIAAAEQQADEIRQSAAAEAREMVVKAREDAQSALAQVEKTERERAQAENETAQREGERLSADMIQSMASEADELCARANTRLNNAVSYLVDKVIKPA